MSTQNRAGWSLARILFVTAVIGGLGGTMLGLIQKVEELPDALLDEGSTSLVPSDVSSFEPDPMAPDLASLAGLPVYPSAEPRRLMKNGSAQTSPMSVSWFSTSDSVQVVLDFYEKAFVDEGREPLRQHLSDDMGSVAWLEGLPDAGPGEGVLHMVSVMKQFSQTIVLLSASRPDLSLASVGQLPEGLVLPPTASAPQIVHLGEGFNANAVVYAQAANTVPAEVAAFFRQQFEQLGYSVGSTSTDDDFAVSMTAQRGESKVVVAARAEGVHSTLMVTYERSGP